MKAITYSTYGPPDVLKFANVEKPVPTNDEMLIRVRAAEATKSDCEMRSFKFAVKWFRLPLRIAFETRKPKRQILGGYFSGEIESIKNMIEQGKIVSIVHKVFPMEQAADAHRSVEAEQRLGAAVITIGDLP